MVDAVREIDVFGVHEEWIPFGSCLVNGFACEDFVDSLTNGKVVSIILLEHDVTPGETCLCEVVDQLFLRKR